MAPLSPTAFVTLSPHLSLRSSFTPRSKCPRFRHSPTYSRKANRAPTVARVRRGELPDPKIHDSLFEVEPLNDIDYNLVDFSAFKGKVVFVVNVASNDQYTDPMYKFLARLLDTYQSQGFEVIAFPCNWFGQKETGTNEEIKTFVETTYSDKITLMTKHNIEWNEVFALGQEYFPGEIIWNFHGKFIFDRKGIPVERFDLLSSEEHVENCIRRVLAGLPKQEVDQETDLPETQDNDGLGDMEGEGDSMEGSQPVPAEREEQVEV